MAIDVINQGVWCESTPSGLPGVHFTDPSGTNITEIQCGLPYNFEVPGCTRVWLHMTRDGTVTYNGEFNVPMTGFVSSCATDVGNYYATVYNLDTGQFIGNASLQVTPAPDGSTGGGGGTVTIGGTAIPVWALVAGGAVLLLALGRKKKA